MLKNARRAAPLRRRRRACRCGCDGRVARAEDFSGSADHIRGPADYDNNAAQTTGVFRDFLNGTLINQGNDLGGTGHTALNFTGSDNNAALAGRITLYDTSPSTTAPTTFSGNISISADILIHPFNNAKGAGILFLFNEGAGQNGLALHLWNAGNSNSNKIELVAQTGEARPGAALATVALGNVIAQDLWYQLQMDLQFTVQILP